jgi:hypothetical protein
MTITCYWLSGTGFGAHPDGISQTFGAALDRDRFEFVPLRYPAAYGGPLDMSYAASVDIGKHALLDAVRATPNRVAIGGYSQGAGIAGTLAAEIARGEHRRRRTNSSSLEWRQSVRAWSGRWPG